MLAEILLGRALSKLLIFMSAKYIHMDLSSMDCPRCKKEMIKGFVFPYLEWAPPQLWWQDEKTGKEECIAKPKYSAIGRLFAGGFGSKSVKLKGFRCRGCKMITFQEGSE
jgi:hypothetical protein